jgi:serine protease Do
VAGEAQQADTSTEREGSFRRERGSVVVSTRGPRLGVSLDTSPNAVTDARGARIRDVLADSPAEEAGLAAGDVITELNGHRLIRPLPDESADQMDWEASLPAQRLQILARRLEPGDTVDITYRREGTTRSTRVIAGGGDRVTTWTFPEGVAVAPEVTWIEPGTAAAGPTRLPPRSGYRGMELAPLNPGLATYFDTDGGVLVVDVGGASALGLRAGDVIRSIGGRSVDDVSDVHRILGSYHRGEVVELTVIRHGDRISFEGTAW